jgi:hypothetical protein
VRGKEECGGTRFLQKGARARLAMLLRSDRANLGKEHQDACWPHAQWTGAPSGKNSYIGGDEDRGGFDVISTEYGIPEQTGPVL